jgi:hypothetical protein
MFQNPDNLYPVLNGVWFRNFKWSSCQTPFEYQTAQKLDYISLDHSNTEKASGGILTFTLPVVWVSKAGFSWWDWTAHLLAVPQLGL